MGNPFRLKAIEKKKAKDERQESGINASTKHKDSPFNFVSQSIGTWDPFQTSTRCIICWKPLKESTTPIMECPHCHSKAHQDHMLRWLAKKNYCPYCRNKW
jgi:DNA-directed RNA polymerase subunit RPC12/RpoP